MTPVQQKLRQLRERQSKERGRDRRAGRCRRAHRRDAEPSWTPSKPAPRTLERQIRAATTAAETEETEQRDAAATGNRDGLDAEDRERLELRKKVRMSNYIVAAVGAARRRRTRA